MDEYLGYEFQEYTRKWYLWQYSHDSTLGLYLLCLNRQEDLLDQYLL